MCILDGSCIELTKVNTEMQANVFFLYHYYRRHPGSVGGSDDFAGQHLLDLHHLLPSNSWVLSPVRLAERWPVGLNRVLQQQGAAKVVLSLAKYIAELFEEAVQLLLLERWEMLRYVWLTHGSWFGGRGFGIGDDDDLEEAYILPRVQAERLWAVVVDSYPHFGATGKRGNSGHKRQQIILGTKINVLGGPRVVASDKSGGLGENVCHLQ